MWMLLQPLPLRRLSVERMLGPGAAFQQPGHAGRDGGPSAAPLPGPAAGSRAQPAQRGGARCHRSAGLAPRLRQCNHGGATPCFPAPCALHLLSPGARAGGDLLSPCYRYAKYHLNTLYVFCLGTHQ